MSTTLYYTMSEKKRETAIGKAIKTYGNQLFSFIRNKVKSLEDAEDILQDVWYQFSRLSDLDELESISAWLYSVSRNKITDFYRKKKTEKLEDFTYENEDENFQIRDLLLIDDQNPEMEMFKELVWEEFFKALDELPNNQKQVFIQNELEDKTLQEIADITGENLKTIISRKGYAVKHLRKKLLPLYNELFN